MILAASSANGCYDRQHVEDLGSNCDPGTREEYQQTRRVMKRRGDESSQIQAYAGSLEGPSTAPISRGDRQLWSRLHLVGTTSFRLGITVIIRNRAPPHSAKY